MVYMIEKKYINQDMNIELTSYIDSKQNVWFREKDIAEILGYKDTRHTLKRHVSKENKMIQLCCTPKTRGSTKYLNCWRGRFALSTK